MEHFPEDFGDSELREEFQIIDGKRYRRVPTESGVDFWELDEEAE